MTKRGLVGLGSASYCLASPMASSLPTFVVYGIFMFRLKKEISMPEFSNDDLPSGNPSLKTVMIVLGGLAVVGLLFTFHSALGL